MDNNTSKQIGYLVLGLSMFFSVMYLSSHNSKSLLNHSTHLNNIIKEIQYGSNMLAKQKNVEMPNIVFILTDDQDVVLGGAEHMQNVNRYIKNKGSSFKNSFVASPLCCPSRSSILTGQYVHNHKAINNSITGGCSSKSWQNGPEKKTFVNYLHQSGYETFFAGKYLNQYGSSMSGGLSHVPPGWDHWVGLEGNSVYYNYNLSINGAVERHGNDSSKDYLTNVMREKASSFLNNSHKSKKPFFMMLSTPACHAPFDSEPKYSDKFNTLKAPRTKNFNIVNDKSKHWLLRLGEQPLRKELVDKIDEIARKRLRTLLTVDDMVGNVVESLRDRNLLDSTYLVFTSDNGYHLGQFSLPLDKREPYESDIRVPFYISGPGIESKTINYPVTNIDIAPTILNLAGLDIPKQFDGSSITPLLGKHFIDSPKSLRSLNYIGRNSSSVFRKTVLVEHSGEGHEVSYGCEQLGPNLSGCNVEFDCKCEDSVNNTYSCLRHVSKIEDFSYCLWDDDENFEEYFDLINDECQIDNVVSSLSTNKRKKLKFLLNNFKKCKGAKCAKLSKFIL